MKKFSVSLVLVCLLALATFGQSGGGTYETGNAQPTPTPSPFPAQEPSGEGGGSGANVTSDDVTFDALLSGMLAAFGMLP